MQRLLIIKLYLEGKYGSTFIKVGRQNINKLSVSEKIESYLKFYIIAGKYVFTSTCS